MAPPWRLFKAARCQISRGILPVELATEFKESATHHLSCTRVRCARCSVLGDEVRDADVVEDIENIQPNADSALTNIQDFREPQVKLRETFFEEL